jgi:hypothetical protein
MQNFKLKLIEKREEPKPSKAEKPDRPTSILDPRFKYTQSSKTNIRNTWKRHGWKPVEK